MKVLTVVPCLDKKAGGGLAERTIQMSRALAHRGCHTAALTTELHLQPQRRRDLESWFELHTIPLLNERFVIPSASKEYLTTLISQYDVVILMGHWSPLNAIVYSCLKKLRHPYAVCPGGALVIFGRSRPLKIMYNRFVGRAVVRNANAHIAVTAGELSQFEAYGVPHDRVQVIPNGINPEDYIERSEAEFRERHRLGNRPFILFLGRLNLIKGPDLLAEAFCRLGPSVGDYQVVFAGPDEGMGKTLREIASRAGMSDRIHVIGFLDTKEKSQALNACELFALPSRSEAMSIVALEAAAVGKPVLLTDTCGFEEAMQIGGGHIVRATAEGLSEGLATLITDPLRMRSMGEKFRSHVLAHYTWDAVSKQLYDVLSELA